MNLPPPLDPGLQPERTSLAWRRTSLSIAVGSLIAVRVLPDMLGSAWWAVLGVLGVAFSGILWASSHSRARTSAFRFRAGTPLPGGGLLALLAAFAITFGVAAVAIVLR